jgi:hypothetical protein
MGGFVKLSGRAVSGHLPASDKRMARIAALRFRIDGGGASTL